MSESSYVFVWKWESDKNAHVWHSIDRDSADVTWRERFAFECQLNDHLRTIEVQPHLDAESTKWACHANQARTIVRTIKTKMKEAGYNILSSRDRASIKGNDGEARPCWIKTAWASGGWAWFPSIREAAKAMRLDQSAVTLACQKGNAAMYADEVDQLLD